MVGCCIFTVISFIYFSRVRFFFCCFVRAALYLTYHRMLFSLRLGHFVWIVLFSLVVFFFSLALFALHAFCLVQYFECIHLFRRCTFLRCCCSSVFSRLVSYVCSADLFVERTYFTWRKYSSKQYIHMDGVHHQFVNSTCTVYEIKICSLQCMLVITSQFLLSISLSPSPSFSLCYCFFYSLINELWYMYHM